MNEMPTLNQRPVTVDELYAEGVRHQQAGRLADAINVWGGCVARAPGHLAAWQNLVLGACMLGQMARAMAACREALVSHPHDRILWAHFGNLLFRQGDLVDAAVIYKQLGELPADRAARNNHAMVLKEMGRADEAEAIYRALMTECGGEEHARIEFNLANLLLSQNRLSDGFAAYEARLGLRGAMRAPWGLPPFRPDLPSGSHIMLWSEQGLGDALMFLRFAPALAARGYRLSAFVQEGLDRIVATFDGLEAVYTPMADPVAADAALAFGSLPHAVGLDLAALWPGSYLTSRGGWSPFGGVRGSRPRVGIVWAGNPSHMNDHQRSMAFASLEPLLTRTDIDWVSLQKGKAATDLAQSPLAVSVLDLSAKLIDFSDTAAVLDDLDLLISVDTSVVHLAGALGCPVWTLLPAIGEDWRWAGQEDVSVWYPSMRLFRQTMAGDWDDVLYMVNEELSRRFA